MSTKSHLDPLYDVFDFVDDMRMIIIKMQTVPIHIFVLIDPYHSFYIYQNLVVQLPQRRVLLIVSIVSMTLQ